MRESVKRIMSYREIAEQLRKEIREGKLKPGTPVISSRALARSCGVSLSTAHKAMDCLVKEELLFCRRGSGTYVKSPETAGPDNFLIGCSIRPQAASLKLEKLLNVPESHLIDELRKRHCRIRLIPNHAYLEKPSLSDYLNGLDGLLISAVAVKLIECAHLHTIRIPTVVFNGDYEYALPFHQILPDHMTGLREIFSRAADWKFKGVVIVYPDHLNGRARRDACISAAEEYGFSGIECMKAGSQQTDFHQLNYYKLGLEIAHRCRNRLIFTCTDMATFDIIRAFHDSNMTPAEDYHLVGYDDVEGHGLSPCAEPTATALSVDREKIMRFARELLFSEIRHPSGVTHIIRIPTKLVIRKTAFQTR